MTLQVASFIVGKQFGPTSVVLKLDLNLYLWMMSRFKNGFTCCTLSAIFPPDDVVSAYENVLLPITFNMTQEGGDWEEGEDQFGVLIDYLNRTWIGRKLGSRTNREESLCLQSNSGIRYLDI